MEEKYILELSRDEIIMIQELSSDTDCSYVWMQQVANNLNEKAMKAYQKPVMSRAAMEQEIEKEWMHYYLKVGEAVADEMARAKRCELSFHYQITEE